MGVSDDEEVLEGAECLVSSCLCGKDADEATEKGVGSACDQTRKVVEVRLGHVGSHVVYLFCCRGSSCVSGGVEIVLSCDSWCY